MIFLYSWIVKLYLRMRGIKVGKRFRCTGWPRLKIHGSAKHIEIGDNVSILGSIDIRNRERGLLRIYNNVTIEDNCRFVTACDGRILIYSNTVVGRDAIWNGGGDIIVGEWCAISARSSINANAHGIKRDEFIRKQPFSYGNVVIQDDCLIGANVYIDMDVYIRAGSVIGANSVVTHDTEACSINAGAPARKIGERK